MYGKENNERKKKKKEERKKRQARKKLNRSEHLRKWSNKLQEIMIWIETKTV